MTPETAVVIPALNEEASIGLVIAEIPDWVRQIIVADNGSSDSTAEIARAAGADVVNAPTPGYGSACLAGLAALDNDPPEVVVFLDADYSDYPEQMARLIEPIKSEQAELVIGSRITHAEPGALTPVQVFGNALATRLIRLIWGQKTRDLGPFRAITWDALKQLEMADPDFGWTVEMQVKAAKRGIRAVDVDVGYRPRIGTSKISGTVMGSVRAGKKILGTIACEAIRR